MNIKEIFQYKNLRGICEPNINISNNAQLSGYVYLGDYSIIESSSAVCNALIGRMVHIGSNVQIGSGRINNDLIITHPFAYRNPTKFFNTPEISLITKNKYYYENNPLICIEADCRICNGAFISSGVHIGRGSIVYPNSVVVTDVPAYSVVAGNPARVIQKRFNDNIIKILSELKLECLSFDNLFWSDKLLNFGDLTRLPLYKGKERAIKKIQFNSKIKFKRNFFSNKIVLGPSHLTRWVNYIEKGNLLNPDFELWGVSGLSIFSKSIDNCLDFWINSSDKAEIVILVPDFRIGNSCLISDSSNPLFIYKHAMKISGADEELKFKFFRRLDDLIHSYGSRVKLIFWCQYGREMINRREGKYVDKESGEYHHIITYNELKKRYEKNIIDIEVDKDKYFSLIETDGSIHPTLEGYLYLTNLIQKC